MTIADYLTLLRLVFIPCFLASFLLGREGLALFFFVAAGVTDILDGMVARLIRKTSVFGAIADPIADKLLLETCFAALVVAGVLPLWFLCLALLRDLMIVFGIFYIRLRKVEVIYRPFRSSKIATLFQLLTAGFGILLWGYPQMASGNIPHVLSATLLIASLFILMSGIQYFLLGWRVLFT